MARSVAVSGVGFPMSPLPFQKSMGLLVASSLLFSATLRRRPTRRRKGCLDGCSIGLFECVEELQQPGPTDCEARISSQEMASAAESPVDLEISGLGSQ